MRLLPSANLATDDKPRTVCHAGTAGTGVTLPSSISGQARGAARAGPGMHPGLLSTSPRGALLAGARAGSFGAGELLDQGSQLMLSRSILGKFFLRAAVGQCRTQGLIHATSILPKCWFHCWHIAPAELSRPSQHEATEGKQHS